MAGWSAWRPTIAARVAVVGAPAARPPAASSLAATGPAVPVQIFGRADSRPTQKALRFFRERRIPVTFVNLAQRPIAPTELRRFTSRFGAAALLDTESRAYREQGLAYMSLDDVQVLERLLSNQSLLRLPLVRAGDRLSVGGDEKSWRDLLA